MAHILRYFYFAPHHVFGLPGGFASLTPLPFVPVFPFPAYAFHMRPHSSVYKMCIRDRSSAENRKQELRGRIWAYNNQVGLRGIIDAYLHNCQNLFETAEYLGVTEEFLNDSLTYYTNKYGVCTCLLYTSRCV